ncbi:SPFH domain-containing protein [Kribbella sp. NPDC026611]|uniref:SPFH domain-containing protein n=1 Tax=Kribbella sp. NPDC026611 TaxID=3154911 RepID=UPI0034098220
MLLWTYLGAAAAALIVLIIILKLIWRVAEPNEALIISGLGAHSNPEQGNETLGFKIVVGRGTAVLPGFQTVRRLSLGIRATPLAVTCVSSQGIPLHIKGVTAYKVGDDYGSIANAARRFLEQSDEQVMHTIHDLFAGHLRAIVGSTTVEEMLHDRETLTANIRSSLIGDMEKLGLVADSLQIQEIDDESGYIRNLGRPQAAAVEAAARIAQANQDREATEKEQVAAAAKAAAVRESEIAKARYQAEIDQATSKSFQAGPLAAALAKQEVVVAETETAKLNASLAEKQLESSVQKPADAEAYKQRTLAQAARDAQIAAAEADARQVQLRGEAQAKATELTGKAEASAVQAKAMAEAAGIKARAEALATNTDAVVAQQLAEAYPEIVAAAAGSFEKVGNMVVLNGAQGIEDTLVKTITMGGSGFALAKQLIESLSTKKDEQPAALESVPDQPA